jgi:hypothetical protein
MNLVHIVPFDRRGVMSYALRVPYHTGFIEALKILIVPLKRAWSVDLRAWIVDISEIEKLHRVLNVMFFPEEFCTFCWQQKPCVDWLGDLPRTEGRVLPWPSESRQATEHPEPKQPKKKAQKAPKPPKEPREPKKPRKPKAPKVKPPEAQPEPPPPAREQRTAPPPRPATPPPPRASSIPPHRPVRGVASAENILGVRFPYTVADIKSAFRRKALDAHPDRPGGSTEAFLRVSEARDLLLRELGEAT